MEWQHAFPEPIDSFEGLTDRAAIQAYISAVRAAGEERAAAWSAGTAAPTDADLDEAEAFQASLAAAVAADETLAAAEQARTERLGRLGFTRPEAPPPAPAPAPAPTVTVAEPEPPASEFAIQPQVVAVCNVGDFVEGQQFESILDTGKAMIARAKRLTRANTGERFGVARIENYIPEALRMPEDPMAGFAFLHNDRYDEDGLVAGFCAPPTVDYSFCGGSSSDRPVLGSLRRYIAPRGRVTKMVTPLFSDTGTQTGEVDTTGIGQWTDADDDADPFVEKLCSILNCVGTEDFEVYSTYKCVTIKNFLQLAFPEYVAFVMNQLDAHWARFAEILLLDQIEARAGAAITTTTTYSTWPTFLSRLNELLTAYTENERYAETPGLRIYMPRWFRAALKSDHIRRTGMPLSNAEIARGLADIGVGQAVWCMDNPTSVGTYTTQAKGAALVSLPSTAWCYVTRPDNLRLLDLGAVDIGITTEREYRDTTTNVRNEFQMFVESFEGLLDMGCPVWNFEIPNCASGLLAPISGHSPYPCDPGD